MPFDRLEYETRWTKVYSAMADRGYETLLVWQRGAGTFDRIGDVLWLTNFMLNGTGQDPASEAAGAPYTFSAVLLRRGREPELHIGLPQAELDLSHVVCGKIVSHSSNLVLGLAEYFRAEGVHGRVALVGDDVLPGMYDRLLRQHTPQIEWHSDETLLLGPQLIKSARELEVYRIAGDLVSRGLSALMEALLGGESSAEAASRAAAIIMRGGGGFFRIDTHHGASTDRCIVSGSLYGYETQQPRAGELARAWIYGPIYQGYWLDPGRTGVCGKRPSSAQKALLTGAIEVVDALVAAMKPGTTPRQLGNLGEGIARKHGYFDHAQLNVPLLGHGLGTNFIPYLIPIGPGEEDPEGKLRYDEPLQAGMVMAAEIFLTHPGVGTAGFEQNLIVTEEGPELLTKSPMVWW